MKTDFVGTHCYRFGSRWLYIWSFFAIHTIAQIESFLSRGAHDARLYKKKEHAR
jgi:hypothetical protein